MEADEELLLAMPAMGRRGALVKTLCKQKNQPPNSTPMYSQSE
jgi:hypothetical protein